MSKEWPFSPELVKEIERLLAWGERMKGGINEYDAGYLAGRREQARVDKEAVENLKLDKDATSGYVRGVCATSAALTAVAPGESSEAK